MRACLLFALLTGCTISRSAGIFDDPVSPEDTVPCATADDVCPERSFCEPEMSICTTDVSCLVDGEPSNHKCQNVLGPSFGCFEHDAEFRCVPVDRAPN